jgi:hypothetical protein
MKIFTLTQLSTFLDTFKEDLTREQLVSIIEENVDLLLLETDFPKKRSLKFMMNQIMAFVEPMIQEKKTIKFIISKVTKELFLDGSTIKIDLEDEVATKDRIEAIFSYGLNQSLDDIEKRGYHNFKAFVDKVDGEGKVIMIDTQGKENLIFSYVDHVVSLISFLKEKKRDGDYSLVRVGKGSEKIKYKCGVKVGKSEFFDLDGNLVSPS